MNRLRLPVLLACLLALPGCWLGEPWFAASQAVPALPPGRYHVVDAADHLSGEDFADFARQPDGSLLMSGLDGERRAIIVALPGLPAQHYLVQVQTVIDSRAAPKAAFLILDTSDGRYRLATPDCGDAIEAIARRAGGEVSRDPQMGALCDFNSPDSLIAGVHALQRDDMTDEMELIPAPR